MEGYTRCAKWGRESFSILRVAKGSIASGLSELLLFILRNISRKAPSSLLYAQNTQDDSLSPFLFLTSDCHCPAGQETGSPGSLEIETAGDAVDIEDLAREIEPGHAAALHGFEVDFVE